MKATTTAKIAGTAAAVFILANLSAKLHAKNPNQAAFERFFLNTNVKPALRDSIAALDSGLQPLKTKFLEGALYVENFTTSARGTILLKGIFVHPDTLEGICGKRAIEPEDMVGAYNLGGIPILVLKNAVIAIKEGNQHDFVVFWKSGGEIESVEVTAHAGNTNLALIKVENDKGEVTKLLLDTKTKMALGEK